MVAARARRRSKWVPPAAYFEMHDALIGTYHQPPRKPSKSLIRRAFKFFTR
jgi:hypothetical protein